jgi:hypothetical protein
MHTPFLHSLEPYLDFCHRPFTFVIFTSAQAPERLFSLLKEVGNVDRLRRKTQRLTYTSKRFIVYLLAVNRV